VAVVAPLAAEAVRDGMPGDLSGRYRSISHVSQRSRQQELVFTGEVGGSEASSGGSLPPLVHQPYGPALPRTESSPSGVSSSSSINQKTPARSFFHRSFHGSLGRTRNRTSILVCSLTVPSLQRCSTILFTGGPSTDC